MEYATHATCPSFTLAVWSEDGRSLLTPADVVKWGGNINPAPPEIGTRVRVSMNNLGTGTVRGYFVEANWLGLLVKLDNPPAWWREQNKGDPGRLAHIFGPEYRID